jgi:transcriptional regulator with XRE-family HTH domain
MEHRKGMAGRTQPAPRKVGKAIRRLREAHHLSVRTLAASCGFSASFLSQVELGRASPSIASLERFALALLNLA